jgi:hypothetical protein
VLKKEKSIYAKYMVDIDYESISVDQFEWLKEELKQMKPESMGLSD